MTSAAVPARVRNLDELRRSNVADALRIIHESGSLSRAELTRALGLTRSTVATILSDLSSRDLVVVGEALDTKRIGRPSAQISPSERHVVIAVSLDLDATTLGVVTLGGRLLREVRFDHVRPPDEREVVNIVAALVAGMQPELGERHVVRGIALAVPGLVSAVDGGMRLSSVWPWTGASLTAMLSDALGVEVWAANDASCGVVAEVLFGAGRGSSDVVYLYGGATGIGGGIVADGRVLRGHRGFSGELGHIPVVAGGRPCACGSRGCLEAEVDRQALLDLADLGQGEQHELEAVLARGYEAGGEVRSVIDGQLDRLAVAIRAAADLLDPEMIVLGGFLGILGQVGAEHLERMLAQQAPDGPSRGVRIARSQLRGADLLIGAAELGFAGLLDDPMAVPAELRSAELA